jgi:hypothetical protein
MKLTHGNSYKTRDGKNMVKVSLVSNGTNYKFGSVTPPYQVYLPTGHVLSESIENDKDLVELIEKE